MRPEHSRPSPRQERRTYIELLSEFFERIALLSYDHRWVTLSICLVLGGACTYVASGVRFDNSFEAYFNRNDPAYHAYLEFREDFGSDEVSYILYEAPDEPYGPWNLGVMNKIEKLTTALEDEVPFVKEVTSLVNVEFIEAMPEGLKIYDLLDEFPDSQEALLEIKKKILAKPMYVGGLASADGKHAAIIMEMDKSSIDPLEEIMLDPGKGTVLDNLYPQATHNKIEEILSRPEYRGIRFHHTGDVPLNAVYNTISTSESWWLGTICAAMIGATLLLFFRRPIGVIGPLTVVTFSVVISVALVGLLGWQLDLMFSMLPTLLIAVGVANGVHIISEFRAFHADLGNRREAVRRSMYLVGTPCLLTSATTAAGFASMSISPIKAISRFAIYSAAGVMVAFLLSVTLFMLFLFLARERPQDKATEKEKLQAKGGQWFRAALGGVAHFDIRYRKAIMVFFAVVFAFSGFGMLKLTVDSNFLTDFSEDVPIRQTTIYVDETMGGTGSFIYLFDSGIPDGIKEPQVLREIERLQTEADKHSEVVKKTYSIVDVLKDINQSFHDGDPAYHVLPETRDLVAQYLLLYESGGGDEVQDYVSSDYSRATLELRCRWTASSLLARMASDLDAYLQNQPLRTSKASVTGIGALWLELLDYITRSQIQGFLLAFAIIAAMMCLLFGSIKTGLLSMIPNLTPVMLTLGGMGWLDTPLDYTRLFIGSVAIGIAVDYSIHLVTRCHHEFLRCQNYEQALHAAMTDVGRALFITSVVLVLGFLTFLFSVMDSQAAFGVLLAGTIVTALVANFFLMPALLLTFKPFGTDSSGRHEPVA